MNYISAALKASAESTQSQVMASLRTHAEEIEAKRNLDFWPTEEGQEMLKEKSNEREDKKGRSLSPLDFDDKSKALLQG